MRHNFQDKVVLITGGSSGIGRAAALSLAKAGARVVIAARGEQRGTELVAQLKEDGADAVFVRADMAKPPDIEALFGQIARIYGRLDCAFNNAAVAEGAFMRTADFDEDEFERTVAANLKGVWLCMKHEIRQMLEQNPSGGAIVNTSSVNGLGGAPQGALYSATKAGVLALTKSASQDYAKDGIRVNALVAGAFRTPMLEGVFKRAAGDNAAAVKSVEAAYVRAIPAGRLGRPEEAAEVVLWLLSDSSSYVTGHSMIVDGGMTASVR
jgi:NAD(P)-dependent dehydrogenase (short-subunit alcohol dehydrogenase family)